MKKAILSGFLLIYIVGAFAQFTAPTTPQPRNAVLEEFTGIKCPNCPDGHARANALAAANPGRVVIINIHEGSYAIPSAGHPDFRTAFGASLVTFSGLTGYPAGMMNRLVWPGTYNQAPYYPQNPPNKLAIRRPGWWDTSYPGQTTGEYIINNGGNTPVNMAANTTFNASTRNLTVDVELYYTADDTVTNEINVVLMESGIVGYQSGSSAGNNYVHNHVMRHMLTGQWGDTVSTTSAGTKINRSYNYTVPANFDINNCDVAVFVTRNDHKTIHTGIEVSANNSSAANSINEHSQNIQSLVAYPNPVTNKELSLSYSLENNSDVSIRVYNMLGGLVKELTENKSAGSHTNTLDLYSLRSGVYILTLSDKSSTITKKFTVQ